MNENRNKYTIDIYSRLYRNLPFVFTIKAYSEIYFSKYLLTDKFHF